MKAAFFSIITLLYSCGNTHHESLPVRVKLPKDLHEVSGIVAYGDGVMVIEDGNNTNVLYQLDAAGKLIRETTVINVLNTDWEDLTRDVEGSLYIGDFGNNDNIRRDLAIYKIAKDGFDTTSVSASQKTSFYYPEQTEFPPKKKNLFYDCEAFFEMNGFFYLFTKNRSKDFDGTTFLYKIPNKQGHFAAQRIGQFTTCDDYYNCCITGAAISPNQKKVVLLGHSKVWLFENFKDDGFFDGKATELPLNHYSQKEAVCFSENNTLLIADEKDKKTGGNVYKVALNELKAKP